MHNQPVQDRSNIIASITCLSGGNNGSFVVNNCGALYDSAMKDWIINEESKMVKSFKKTIFCQNLFSSQNRQLERIIREFINDNGIFVYELGYQLCNPIFYDMNTENWGWNRQQNEGRWQHWKRLRESKYYSTVKDTAFTDLNPIGNIKIHEKLRTYKNTHYFSLTTGFKNQKCSKNREVFNVPRKITQKVLGFNPEIDEEIAFRSQQIRHEPAKQYSRWNDWKYEFWGFIKYLWIPAFSHFTFYYETMNWVQPQLDILCNLHNPEMNNIGSIDYANSDWIDDNDFCIARKCSEFPRITSYYNNMLQKSKPWGIKSDPILYDILDDPIMQHYHMQPGVWYYGGIPQSDHLDLCGLPDIFGIPRRLIGIEYRYEAWRLLFIRLKMLKFDK